MRHSRIIAPKNHIIVIGVSQYQAQGARKLLLVIRIVTFYVADFHDGNTEGRELTMDCDDPVSQAKFTNSDIAALI